MSDTLLLAHPELEPTRRGGAAGDSSSCANDGGGMRLTIKGDVKRGIFPLRYRTCGVGIKCA
jgi:hypothetical protein